MNKYLFVFCFLALSFPLCAQDNNQNNTDAAKNCLCGLPNGRSYKCSCSDPRAINAPKPAEATKSSGGVAPTDLIDQSSTASHINPDEWQERNPQHTTGAAAIAAAVANPNNPKNIGRRKGRGQTKGATFKKTGEYTIPAETSSAEKEDSSFDDALGAAFVGAVVGQTFSTKTHKKTKSKSKKKTSSSPNCKSECKASGCVWQGETFTDPSTGLKGCVCGC